MGLPGATLTFTIPSITDDTTLDCHIYHPAEDYERKTDPEKRVKRKRCAVVAHPYATLGGCCDDPVVGIVASQILQEGFVVCTFNFRYALLHTGREVTAKQFIEGPVAQKAAPHGRVGQRKTTTSLWPAS
jgi:hypothetical protein